jgi:hypothetical protein
LKIRFRPPLEKAAKFSDHLSTVDRSGRRKGSMMLGGFHGKYVAKATADLQSNNVRSG